MVFKRKSDCGSNGLDFANIPKAPRSCRRKILSKNTDDCDQICAFDLLASLAGKLLQETESSSASTNAYEGDNHNTLGTEIKQEQVDEYKPFKTETPDLKSTDETISEKCILNSFPLSENDGILERTPTSDYNEAKDLKPVMNTEFEEQGKAINGIEDGNVKLHVSSPESVHSDGNVNHTELGGRDDDENFDRYYKFSHKFKTYRTPTRIGDRRIRKLLSSKYWKAVPKMKDFEHKRTDGGLKTLYRKRKSCYGYSGWQRETLYKRKRSSDRGSVVTSDGGLSSESITNSPEKGETANGVISPGIGLQSRDSHVKFSIKSFRIPELFVEVPETTTVGSLKRTVLEAVTALLGDGIRVGVLVQGKKVRDDGKTLSQTGISCKENLSNLGFALEPGSAKISTPLCSEDPIVSIPSDSMNFSERSPECPVLEDLRNVVENNNELVAYESKSDGSGDEPGSDSRALVPVTVPVPAIEVEALAIVPMSQKPKRAELAQRRTRRPFSVTEVEALVEAVEELGTGRWRDVKIRAFDNANHRTYVDLKDKWKTLVHTASISPHQRRGEPVPQELLDRVLAAHGYWSQHHVRQNGKQQGGGVQRTWDTVGSDRSREVGAAVQTGSM